VSLARPGVARVSQLLRGRYFGALYHHRNHSDKSKRQYGKEKGPPCERPFFKCRLRLRCYTVRILIVHAEPRPITWAWPALALGTRRSFARSSCVRCHTTSQMFATPVAPRGCPFESRPPDTLTGAKPPRSGWTPPFLSINEPASPSPQRPRFS